jgi:hypothetical protein
MYSAVKEEEPGLMTTAKTLFEIISLKVKVVNVNEVTALCPWRKVNPRPAIN